MAGFLAPDGQIRATESIAFRWAQYDQLTDSLAPFVVYFADAKGRLNFPHEIAQRPDIADPPAHPLHKLQDDPSLLQAVSRRSHEVFRQPLTLDRLSQLARLRVGVPDVAPPTIDAVTPEYRAALSNLVPVSEQGDGMRSFMSLLLPLITGISKVVIIDEPEAFLHPPQARALGRTLAELARDKRLQIVLATHDKNLLTGLLEPSDVEVSVVRLTRDNDREVKAHQLDDTSLRTIWSDAALRYTNVLDGLFHRLVVLCEAERDCHFYTAALDSLSDTEEVELPPSEVLFVPSGGKDGMVKLVRALGQISVPVVVSPDLDVLDDENKMRALVETMGRSWQTFAADYRIATQPFRQHRTPARASDVLLAIDAVLRPLGEAPFSAAARESILAHTRHAESPWKALKRYGTEAFLGEAAGAAGRLLDSLDQIGIVLVRRGELERMAPTLGVAKGPAWLPAALDAMAHTDEHAQAHIRRVVEAGRALIGAIAAGKGS
ncbi:AAA family ATPase [Cellulomonas sp. 179-A 9B4 NHS]|uniref:AAA family ATPase n=1 Tax=Cellulomonas sp. 179-A 9B4 NHS TaxID=3142379 RepID=UPI0039A00C0B